MEPHGWINIGYARKPRTNEPVENKIKSIQKMTDCLRIKCHCAKVFLSPMCSSGSKLCQRDTKLNLNLMDSVRHKHGDMQGRQQRNWKLIVTHFFLYLPKIWLCLRNQPTFPYGLLCWTTLAYPRIPWIYEHLSSMKTIAYKSWISRMNSVHIFYCIHRELKSIKELVVYHGHKFESIPRQNVLRGNLINKFDCRPGCVKRSLIWTSLFHLTHPPYSND